MRSSIFKEGDMVIRTGNSHLRIIKWEKYQVHSSLWEYIQLIIDWIKDRWEYCQDYFSLVPSIK